MTELFLRGRKLNITQFYFKSTKTLRLNATHYFIMKIPTKGKIQLIASNHLSNIDFKDFMKIFKVYAKEPYTSNTFLSSDNPLRFRKNLL